MGDLISKARKGRLAALRGRSCATLFPEVGEGRDRAQKTVAAVRARRSVSLFG